MQAAVIQNRILVRRVSDGVKVKSKFFAFFEGELADCVVSTRNFLHLHSLLESKVVAH
jgi:hypothetical protein